jgi:hypothetical protein
MPPGPRQAGASFPSMGTALRTGLVTVALFALLSTSTTGAVRSNCTSQKVSGALVEFVGAFNRGDYETLDSLFATEPDFQWFSSTRPGRRLAASAKNRASLVRYFEARHAKEDRLGVAFFRLTGDTPRHGNWEARFRRSSSDYRSGRWFRTLAKGAAICEGSSVRFIVMSFGGPS